jgi:hypothetical protein
MSIGHMKPAIRTSRMVELVRYAFLLPLFSLLLLGSLIPGHEGNRVAAATMPTDIDPSRQPVITEASVANGKAYKWHKISLGGLVYIDREYVFSKLPAKYLGLFYLQTANDDKNMVGNDFITFQVNQDVTVYVAYANASTDDQPSWLAEWTDTGDEIVTTDRDFGVLAKDFPAGTVSLGGNEGGSSMYTVLVKLQDRSSVIHQPQVDEFGIPMLYPTKPGTVPWSSLHWDDGNLRKLGSSSSDPDDPTRWSRTPHGSTVLVDGKGNLVVDNEDHPRLHIENRNFLNTEITVYYKRINDENLSYGGLVVGIRSTDHVDDECAHTYYARFANTGDALFLKEFIHPVTFMGEIREDLFPGGMPENTWIGMKFVAYTTSSGNVKLELYRDMTEGREGGQWELVLEQEDTGGWVYGKTCDSGEIGSSDGIILVPGFVIIRNSGNISSKYTWMSVREIVAP